MRTRKAWIGVANLIAALALGGLAGCETTPEPTYEEAALSQFIQANYRAADALMTNSAPPAANTAAANNFRGFGSGPLLVATLADINALERSSTLGRVISEHLSSRFAQSGISVMEMKLRNNVFVRNNQGEFLLTREIQELARTHNVSAVVVGTYSNGNTFVFVSLKLIDTASGVILAAHDYALPMDRQVRRLVGTR
jgi:TolB-like protein